MVMGILAVLTISGTTMMAYTSSNTKTTARSKSDESSFSLSEAALNNAMAVLSNPSNNALDPDLLPGTEATAQSATYENGTAKWYGVLDRNAAVWTVTAIGLTNNPTGTAAQVRRKLTAKVPVTPTQTQPSNNPAWNYIFNRRTGNTCDMTLSNNVAGSSQALHRRKSLPQQQRSDHLRVADRARESRPVEQRERRREHEHGHAGRDLRRR